jgi:hypothetical protein
MSLRRIAFVIALALAPIPALAQSTAFTYQGELRQGGAPSNGTFDLRFKLFATTNEGLQIGATLCANNVPVADGRFTALIDFGPAFVTTASRFLEIEVRSDTGLDCSNAGGFITLSPRQALTAAPLASHAKTAFSLAAADGSPADAVTVDNNGQLGIGTAAPTHSVHIANAVPTLALQDTDSTGTSGGQHVGYISYRDSANAERGWIGYGTIGDPDLSIVNARPSGDIVLSPFGGGKVGIGTSTPLSTLHVAGTARIDDNLTAKGKIFTDDANIGAVEAKNLTVTAGGIGVRGEVGTGTATNCKGVLGRVNSSDPTSFGVFSEGRLGATGTKSFRIDHPEYPDTHYLYHYSTESPEAINFYRGTVTLDSNGRAVVRLPSYFAIINKDPSYQLTAIGSPMPYLHVAERISEVALREGAERGSGVPGPACWFIIAGGVPGGAVCWRVDAVRNDAFVREGGAPVEVKKPVSEQVLVGASLLTGTNVK